MKLGQLVGVVSRQNWWTVFIPNPGNDSSGRAKFFCQEFTWGDIKAELPKLANNM